MADPRCNCGEPDCPICRAPIHRPWQPKPGTSPDPLAVENEQLKRAVAYLTHQLTEKRWDSIRRYLLVLLLTNIGALGGGWFSAWLVINYYN